MSIPVSMLAIALGAACGANLRWALGLGLNALFPNLPPGTLAANLLGAWLIGVAIAVFAALPELSAFWKLAVITGFLGALTTFSTFSAEIFTQIQAGRLGWAAAGWNGLGRGGADRPSCRALRHRRHRCRGPRAARLCSGPAQRTRRHELG